MDSNICLGCRFGSVKIEVVVPEKYNLKNFAKQTQNFAAGITAITREKAIHYSITFLAADDEPPKKLDFKIHCSCILNVSKEECSRFGLKEEKNCKVKHLLKHKPISGEIAIES